MDGTNKLFHEHDIKIEMQDNKILLISDNIDLMIDKLEAAYESSQSKIKKSLENYHQKNLKPLFDNCNDKIKKLTRQIDLFENKSMRLKNEKFM